MTVVQSFFQTFFRTYPTPIWISAVLILCVHIQSWPDLQIFLVMRLCTLCEKHKVESTHKLGLGGFQTLRNAAAANGVELHHSVIVGSYLHNRVLLGSGIWIQWSGRYGSTVKVDWGGWRSYFSWSAYFKLKEQVATWVPQLLPESIRPWVFRDTTVITPNLMNIAWWSYHCPWRWTASPFPDQILVNGTHIRSLTSMLRIWWVRPGKHHILSWLFGMVICRWV